MCWNLCTCTSLNGLCKSFYILENGAQQFIRLKYRKLDQPVRAARLVAGLVGLVVLVTGLVVLAAETPLPLEVVELPEVEWVVAQLQQTEDLEEPVPVV